MVSFKNCKKAPKIVVRQPFIYIRNGDFDVVPLNVFVFAVLVIMNVEAYRVMFTNLNMKMAHTMLYTYAIGMYSALCVTAGAHRLWSHKSYKARLPFKIFLVIGHSIAGQGSLYLWIRDHLMHHKFAESDADPHNPVRGFFFAHCGWLLRKKHPQVILQAQKLDLDRIMDDPIVRYQHKYYTPLYLILALILPTLIPWHYWGESLYNSFFIVFIGRYMNILHTTLLINSWGHMFGYRTYTHSVQAGDNLVIHTASIGEGYHNFHHAFPFDYRSTEDGIWFNTTKLLIDIGAILGQVYDRKTVPSNLIAERKEKVKRLSLQA